MHVRHAHRGIVAEQLGDALAALHLAAEIELEREILLHLLHQRHQRHRLRIEALVDGAEAFGVGEIGLHDVRDVGILDLHRDQFAGLQGRAMHLCERGRRDRGALDGDESLVDLRPEFGVEHL